MTIPHFDLEKSFYVVSIIIAVIAILSALGSVWKYIKNIFISFIDKYKHIESSINKINEISEEFKPNHGSSLKDSITKIQLELTRNTELTEKISTRQKWMFDTEEMPIFESDDTGKCVWANVAYLDLVGKDMNSILGHGWKNIIVEEERDRVIHNWELCVKDGRDSEDSYHIIDAKGQKIKVFTSVCKTGKFGYVGAIKYIKEN